jgi:putative glycosyltransferase (TIGR04372 family)
MIDPSRLPDLTGIKNPRNHQAFKIGPGPRNVKTERPYIIFAALLDDTFGDFTWTLIFAMSLKLRIKGARLHVYFRDNRPFKSTLLKLSPLVDCFWSSRGGRGLGLEAFHRGSEGAELAPNETWRSNGAGEPDFFLVPSMMQIETLGAFDPLARFVIPQTEIHAAESVLIEQGLDPTRWFCALHYREPTNALRHGNAVRDIDPEVALGVTRFVIEELGGQVVRLGHPDMTPFPKQEGFVDLSNVENPTLVQAYAMSRARFFLEVSPSGPLSLAMGFGVPMARCNTVRPGGPPDEQSIVLMQHLIDPDGDRVPQDIALERGLLDFHLVDKILSGPGFRLHQNSLAEICAAAREIHDRTSNFPGWRVQEPVVSHPTETAISWPLPEVERFAYVEYPHLMDPPSGGRRQ